MHLGLVHTAHGPLPGSFEPAATTAWRLAAVRFGGMKQLMRAVLKSLANPGGESFESPIRFEDGVLRLEHGLFPQVRQRGPEEVPPGRPGKHAGEPLLIVEIGSDGAESDDDRVFDEGL